MYLKRNIEDIEILVIRIIGVINIADSKIQDVRRNSRTHLQISI